MFFPLLVAAISLARPDTILPSDLSLLGVAVESGAPVHAMSLEQGDAATTLLGVEEVSRTPATVVPARASTTDPIFVASPPARLDFAVYASMPLPSTGLAGAPAHGMSASNELGFSPRELDRAVTAIEAEVRRGALPGAALAVGRWNQPVIEKGIGTVDRLAGSATVDPDHTIYDLASLTKVVATTTAVMLLWEDGDIDLDAPVRTYLPAFSGGDRDRITIRHLLTHTSGLPAGATVDGLSRDEVFARIYATGLRSRPGQRVEYSDLGFIVLWQAAEAAHGAPLTVLLQKRVFGPLGMKFTSFLPGETCVRCAPTLDREGFRGVVHDPIARRLGGVAGHAGLFSTAHDLSRFAAMLASGGELDGVRVLRASTIALFTQRQPGAGVRALGWETPNERGDGSGGLIISPGAFGHTGFTGTSLWVDPQRGTWTVLLSNRTLRPRGANRIQALRREVNDWVANSVDFAR